MNLHVRQAYRSDEHAIADVVIAAFGNGQGQEIADLVSDLLADPSAQPFLSLVGIAHDRVVGHILFTSTQIRPSKAKVSSALLAPLSVHPEHQNRGLGGRLIQTGLAHLKSAGVHLVFVLGHPGYYPKYGFSVAGIKGFEAPYPIPPENSAAWMVQELQPGIIGRVRGEVICADTLNDPKHWRE